MNGEALNEVALNGSNEVPVSASSSVLFASTGEAEIGVLAEGSSETTFTSVADPHVWTRLPNGSSTILFNSFADLRTDIIRREVRVQGDSVTTFTSVSRIVVAREPGAYIAAPRQRSFRSDGQRRSYVVRRRP